MHLNNILWVKTSFLYYLFILIKIGIKSDENYLFFSAAIEDDETEYGEPIEEEIYEDGIEKKWSEQGWYLNLFWIQLESDLMCLLIPHFIF